MFNSLKNKVILLIVVVIALCALVSALIVVITVQYQMSGKYAIEKEAAIESLSLSLATVLDSGDYDQVEKTINSALVFENISSIAVFNKNGILVKSIAELDVIVEELDLAKHSLSIDNRTIGSFEIGFTDEYIDALVLRTVFALIIVLVGFLFLAGLALYIFMNRSIIKPIEQFTRTVGEINPDNLSVRIPIQTKDEIGFLIRTFNFMTDNLEKSHIDLKQSRDELEEKVELRTRGERRRAEQLRAINEVSRRVSSILTLDELLTYVVSSLQQTFNFYNVNIFLVDTYNGVVELKAGTGGYRGTVPIGFQIRTGEGIVGTVAQSQESLLIPDVRKEPRYISSWELPETNSELAVPIKLGLETFGVLDVQSNEIDAFDEIDLFTAQTLGDQLAIAIENARLYLETQEMAVLSERNRMAREIHDTLAQGFTGIVLQLEAAEQTLVEDTTKSQEHLNKARQLARDSLNEARRSVWDLRPQALEQLSLIDTLHQETEKFAQDNQIKTSFHCSRKRPILDRDTENALLRIYQEALNNIRKHAHADNAEIKLSFDEENVYLSIQDDGIGFNADRDMDGGFGLISIRERTRLLGGSLDISSEKGKGTRLDIKIPF